MDAYDALVTRRSLRHFDVKPIARPLLHKLLYAACLAPAPRHTRPWRFVVLETPESRGRLADAMGAAWRRDLEGDEVPPERIEQLLARSRRQIEDAPALVLACLLSEGRPQRPAGGRLWPDQPRRQAEWSMAIQSMGAALQTIMVGAHAEGIASYWISAPLFCRSAVREALDLPAQYQAQALIALGYPAAGASARARPEPDLSELAQTR